MVLDFLNGIYPFIYIPIAIVGILLGADRALKSEEEESDVLKVIGGISGLLLLAMTIILAVNEYNSDTSVISNYTVLFGILLGMSLIARPFKNLPLAFVISIIVALGLLYVLILGQDSSVTFGGIGLEWILIGVMVIVLLVFIVSFIQEQAIDALMFVMGWGPIITILGLVMTIQAITLILNIPNQDGLLSYLPG